MYPRNRRFYKHYNSEIDVGIIDGRKAFDTFSIIPGHLADHNLFYSDFALSEGSNSLKFFQFSLLPTGPRVIKLSDFFSI